jgi:ABC-type multidrug transport system ATPase subunit/pSer/pThr/pTyr-binding forkhead associated (FHA) protein
MKDSRESPGAQGLVSASRGPELVWSSSRKAVELFPTSAEISILGNASGCDVRLEGPGIQHHHARCTLDSGQVRIEPLNGAAVRLNGDPIEGRVILTSGDWLALGDSLFEVRLPESEPFRIAPFREPSRTAVSAPTITAARLAVGSARHLTVGRLADNDIVIPAPIVSRHHARVIADDGHYVLEDLGSTNGTFVNGRRVDQRLALQGGEQVQFGTYSFRFIGGELRPEEEAGLLRLEAAGLEKTIRDSATRKKKKLLADINLVINPGEFVGIFGMSGSGKSTLMDALSGRRQASAGAVLYNGLDLYQSFDLFKPSIGYVPQQDIVHRKISIHNALLYTARLRLPPDTSREEIQHDIARVLQRVALSEKEWQPIDTPVPLSGGQLKRVNLAIELISNPSILFLDEATSGLDAGTDKRMMRLFRELTSDGKTVICVTHTLEHIDACHLVIVLHHGRVAYFGPPQAVADYFKIRRPSDVYDRLESAPAERWAEEYEASPHSRHYIGERMRVARPIGAAPGLASLAAPPSRGIKRFLDTHQASILCVRLLDLLFSDRRNLLLLLLQAPIIGVVIGLVFTPGGALPERGYAEAQIMFILGISAVWMGCLNSAREVVKELPIYLRERSVNLQIGPYLVSKLVPLAGLSLLQCVALLVVVVHLLSVPGDLVLRGLALFVTAMAATTMGLTVSALVNSSDKAIGVIPILLIPQVILSNAVVKLGATSRLVARLTIIAYWSFDCLKGTLAQDVRPWAPVDIGYWRDLGVLILFTLAFAATALIALRWKDRQR